jgi:hypothetical protein
MPAEESEVDLCAEKRVGYATSRYCVLELALDVPAHIPASVVFRSVAYRPYEAGCVRLEKKSEYPTPFVVDMTIVDIDDASFLEFRCSDAGSGTLLATYRFDNNSNYNRFRVDLISSLHHRGRQQLSPYRHLKADRLYSCRHACGQRDIASRHVHEGPFLYVPIPIRFPRGS